MSPILEADEDKRIVKRAGGQWSYRSVKGEGENSYVSGDASGRSAVNRQSSQAKKVLEAASIKQGMLPPRPSTDSSNFPFMEIVTPRSAVSTPSSERHTIHNVFATALPEGAAAEQGGSRTNSDVSAARREKRD